MSTSAPGTADDAAFEMVRQGCAAVPGPASSPSGATTCTTRSVGSAPAVPPNEAAAIAATARARLAKRRPGICSPYVRVDSGGVNEEGAEGPFHEPRTRRTDR